jgi:hypothetical protein
MSTINWFRTQIISKYQGESYDVISHFTSKHIYAFLMKLAVSTRDRQSMSLNPFWKQINPVHTMKSYLRSILTLSLNQSLFSPMLLSRNTNKMQCCNRIYYSRVFKGSTSFVGHTAHHQEH